MADPSLKFEDAGSATVLSGNVVSCAISPDGSLIAAGSGTVFGTSGEACVIDAANGDVLYTVNPRKNVDGVAWHSDGNRFLATCYDGKLTEFTRSNGRWSHRSVYDHKSKLFGCATLANGVVAAGGIDSCVVILDSNADYSLKQKIKGLSDSGRRVAFSSNGSLLAIGCNDGSYYVFGLNESTGQYDQLTKRRHHRTYINSISFSPSDSHLVIGCEDKTASLWNVPSTPMDPSTWPQSPSSMVEENDSFVTGACFTGDGRHVITAALDEGILNIWRVSDGDHVDTIEAECAVYSAAFHPQSGCLIGGLEDGSIQFWQCPPYDPLSPSSYVDARTRLENAQKDI